MGIVNRRNAVVGWAVWKVGKRVARRKAKDAVPRVDRESRRPNRPAAVLAGLTAAAGALVFWRRRRGGADEPSE